MRLLLRKGKSHALISIHYNDTLINRRLRYIPNSGIVCNDDNLTSTTCGAKRVTTRLCQYLNAPFKQRPQDGPSIMLPPPPHSSPGPRSKASSSYSRSPGTDRRTHDSRVVSASGGRYTVAHKDVSLLERISSRQHKQAQRVRKPHEVFVELEEIHADDPNKDPKWEETARSATPLAPPPSL